MSNEQETIVVDGMIFKKPSESAPSFVKGKLSIKIEDFAKFVKAHAVDGWLNIDLKEGKSGKYYAQLDTWKPTKQKEKEEETVVDVDSLPFWANKTRAGEHHITPAFKN